ncbi:MAG TPA: hypothetical protein VGN42_10875 [Pirellulales bacterium]|nr:hypothetical protein [Pirellulales bacterium]
MDYPVIFPLRDRLEHLAPDAVRRIVEGQGFVQAPAREPTGGQASGRGDSEIWYKLAGRGYAIVRIDSQGHARTLRDSSLGTPRFVLGAASGAHGGVPHYHKEWIETRLFPQYLETYVPQVVRYDDAGDPVTGAMNDGKAKQTHIKR